MGLSGGLMTNGGFQAAKDVVPTAVKTTNYQAVAQDYVPVDASGGNVTVTLPNGPLDRTRVGVKLVAVSGANAATVQLAGSDVLNKTGGATSFTLTNLNQGVILQYRASGAIWYEQADDSAIAGGGGSTLTGDIGGTVAANIVQAIGLTKYFRAPTGGDDGAALQTYINAGYTHIVLGPASSSAPFLWTTIPTVAAGSNVTIEGSGTKATFVKCNTTHARFIDPNKTSDYQTFGYTVKSLTYDANNVSGQDAVFGSYTNSTTTLRINWKNVLCEDIDIINLPATLSGAGSGPAGFYFLNGQQNTDPQAASLTDIRIKRCRVFGGRIGFVVGAPGTPNASFPTLIDRVSFEDCYHDTGFIPSTGPAGGTSWANYQIGVNGLGGWDIAIRNCIGKGSNDVGVETDGLGRILIENVDIYNSWNNHFLHCPFQQVADVYAMELIYRNCRGITESGAIVPTAGHYGTTPNGSNTSGHILFDNCWAISETGATITSGQTAWTFKIGSNTTQHPCLSLTFRDCHIDYGGATGMTYTSASPCVVYAASLSAGQVNSTNCRVAFEGQNLIHHNVTQGSTGQIIYRGVALNSSNGTTFDGPGGSVVFDYNSPGQTASNTILIDLSINTSSAKGVLPRLVVNSFAGGDTTPIGIKIPGTAGFTIPTVLVVPNGTDFSGFPTTATEISKTVNQGALVRYGRHIRWAVANPIKTVAQSTSNFTTATFVSGTWNQYIASYDAIVQFLSGAGVTLTAIDISPDNGSTSANVWTQASGVLTQTVAFPLTPGWYVRITAGTTPTCTVIPQT